MSEHDEVVELSLDEGLVELDLDAEYERPKRVRQVKQASICDGLEREARRTARCCEKALGRTRMLIEFSLLSFEEMNLVFRMEAFFKSNKHLGVHWLKQLHRLNRKYADRLVEAQMSANLLE